MPKWIHILKPEENHRLTEQDSIYAKGNKYGYLFNVNHPVVNKCFLEFRKEIGEELFPIGDANRFEFEKRIAEGYYPELNKYIGRT